MLLLIYTEVKAIRNPQALSYTSIMKKIEIEFEFNENRIFNINVEMKNLTLCQRLKEVELLCQLFG